MNDPEEPDDLEKGWTLSKKGNNSGSSSKSTGVGPVQALALSRTTPVQTDEAGSDHVSLPKAASLVAHRLRAQIVRGELGEGDLLPPEAVLVERFNVSRPTLREAFRVLESENLVTIRRGARGGARVRIPDGKVAARHVGFVLEHRGATLQDVYLAREEVEVVAVGDLARSHTRADIRALKARQAEIEEIAVPDQLLFAKNSLTFHQLIVELSGNQTLAVLDEVINSILNRANESLVRMRMAVNRNTLADNLKAHRDHGALIDLIDDGDADGAMHLWRKHCQTYARKAVTGNPRSVLDLLDD
jgi:DNA-binding FadR family transcriptional regulator